MEKGYVLGVLTLAVLSGLCAAYAGSYWQGQLACAALVALANIVGIMEGEARS
jgi:hypothetical protein